MKIHEIITEANPAGTSVVSKYVGQAKQKIGDLKSGIKSTKEKLFGTEQDKIAKQNQKKWYDAVKRKQRQNVNMNDQNTYRNELYKFLSSNKKLKLSRTLRGMVGRLPLTDSNILKIMRQTIDDRITAKQAAASAAAAAAGGGAP